MKNQLWCFVVAGPALAAALLSLSAQQTEGKKYALLVGVNHYDRNELRDLKYSEKDVTALSEVLKDAGFRRVVLMTQTVGAKTDRFSPRAERIREELQGILEDCREEDMVLIALAGHGIEYRDSNDPLFCPMDAKVSKKQNLISLKDVYASLAKSRAGVKLLLVDACRNDPRSDFSKARQEVDLESVTRPQLPNPPRGVAALFSCSAGRKAYESPKLEHGIFFHFVVKGLRGAAASRRTKAVTVDSLTHYVKSEVKDQSVDEFGLEYRQQPALRANLEGDPELVVALKVIPLRITEQPKPPSGEPTRLTLTDLTKKKPLTNSVGVKFVYVHPGSFTMGSPAGEQERNPDEPQHQVEITKGFYMSIHEITQAQYRRVMSKNPSWFSAEGGGKAKVRGVDTDQFPVEWVSWEDADDFCRKLTASENASRYAYDLPTEAEWEYACRAKTQTAFSFGDSLSSRQANFQADFPYGAVEKGPHLGRTTKVGTYEGNGWGLYDMHGNVWEWCKDWYAQDPSFKTIERMRDPQGPTDGPGRVLRGGSWLFDAAHCRSSIRYVSPPASRSLAIGFRVVLRLTSNDP